MRSGRGCQEPRVSSRFETFAIKWLNDRKRAVKTLGNGHDGAGLYLRADTFPRTTSEALMGKLRTIEAPFPLKVPPIENHVLGVLFFLREAIV